LNGKLRDELLNREISDTLPEAKVLIERWRVRNKIVRLHRSLSDRTPAPEAVPAVSEVATVCALSRRSGIEASVERVNFDERSVFDRDFHRVSLPGEGQSGQGRAILISVVTDHRMTVWSGTFASGLLNDSGCDNADLTFELSAAGQSVWAVPHQRIRQEQRHNDETLHHVAVHAVADFRTGPAGFC